MTDDLSSSDGFLSGRLGPLYAALGATLIIYGYEFFHSSFNVDDYSQFFAHPSWKTHGRWFLDVVYRHAFGGRFAPSLSYTVGMLLHCVTAFWLVEMLGFKSAASRYLSTLVFVCHPYYLDLFSFNTGVVACPFAYFLAVAAFWLLYQSDARRWFSFPLGIAALVIAMGTYQTSVSYVLLAFLSYEIVSALRSGRVPDRRRWGEIAKFVASVVAAIVSYLVVTGLIVLIADVTPNRRMSMVVKSLGDVAARARYVASDVLEVLFEPEFVMPFMTAKLLFLFMILVCFALVVRSTRNGDGYSVGRVFWIAVLAAGCVLCVYASVWIVSTDLPLRGKTAYSVIFALVVGLAIDGSGPVVRRTCVIASGILVFSMMLIGSSIMYRQYLSEVYDLHLANRILARIEMQPEYEEGRRYLTYFHGSTSLFPETENSLLRSAFAARWSRKTVFLRLGVRFRVARGEKREAAVAYARGARPWPHRDSVRIIDGETIVIVLSRDAEGAVR